MLIWNMDRFQQTRKIAMLGIIANVILLVAKLSIGLISRSQAMIADGFNSAGDVFASLMTFIGNKISSQPKDKNHPYGHGKAEYIFSMIISFSLILVAFKIFSDSFNSITQGSSFTFSWTLIIIAIFTIVSKALLFIYTRNAGKKTENLLILANSEDHRNDVFVTSATLVGIFFGSRGVYWVDGVVGICISFWIAYTAIKIFSSSYYVLMDTNIDKVLESDLSKTIMSVEGVEHIDSIVAKPVGINYLLIVKISVNGSLSISKGHSIGDNVRDAIYEHDKISEVIVHVNPA